VATRKPRTVKQYLNILGHFIDYLHEQDKSINQVTTKDVQQYLKSKTDIWGYNARTHFLLILKSFMSKFFLDQIPIGISVDEIRYRMQIEHNVKAILNYPLPIRETVLKPKALPLSEIRTLLAEVRKLDTVDHNIIYLLFYTGMRRSELMFLNPQNNINWHDNYIRITPDISKTSSERILYFNLPVRRMLISILREYGSRKRLIRGNDETFLNKVFRRYDDILDKHIHVTPHMCRHSFITEMQKSIRGKTELDESIIIKLLVGHNIKLSDMTAYYTDYTTDLKNAMLRYHYLQ
jgi:integrase